MAYTNAAEPRFASRNVRAREAELCDQYRPVAIGAVAAAKCIRSKQQDLPRHETPAILCGERDSD